MQRAAFYEEGIKSPAYYHKLIYGRRLGSNKPDIGFRYLWDHTGVKRILRNDFYIVTVTCHRYAGLSECGDLKVEGKNNYPLAMHRRMRFK